MLLARLFMLRERVGRIASIVLPLLVVAMALAPQVVASEVQTIPSQGQIPLSKPSPSGLHRQPADNPMRILPGGQGSNTREIPLPKIFRGCWSGTVPQVDSLEQLDTSGGGIQWLAKSYTLCYEQIGAAHWKLTFAEGSVSQRWLVTDQRQHIEVKTIDGPKSCAPGRISPFPRAATQRFHRNVHWPDQYHGRIDTSGLQHSAGW